MKEPCFEFHSGGRDPHAPGSVVARIRGRIDDKRELRQSLATQLSFPDYFGGNWDALEECLADLSWLESKPVCIWHEDLPLCFTREDARTYLEILLGALRESGQRSLIVSFPEAVREEIASLLA